MDEYKDHHKDPRKMSQYIYFWWLPYLERLRKEGNLQLGEKEIVDDGINCQYKGELDYDGNCIGEGKTTD